MSSVLKYAKKQCFQTHNVIEAATPQFAVFGQLLVHNRPLNFFPRRPTQHLQNFLCPFPVVSEVAKSDH